MAPKPKRRWWLARWRDAYWRWINNVYGKDSKTCRNFRFLFLCNGTMVTIAGIICSFLALGVETPPPYLEPSVPVRIGLALLTLTMGSGSGLLAIYFGLWHSEQN